MYSYKGTVSNSECGRMTGYQRILNWKGRKRKIAVGEFSGMPYEYPEKTKLK